MKATKFYALLTALFLFLTGCQATSALMQQKRIYLLLDVSRSAQNRPHYKSVVQQICRKAVGSAGANGSSVTTFLFADDTEMVSQSTPYNLLEQRQICNRLPTLIEERQVGRQYDGTSLPKALEAVRVKLDRKQSNEIHILLDRNENGDDQQIAGIVQHVLPVTKAITLTIADYKLQQQLDHQIRDDPSFKTCPFKRDSSC